MKTLYQVLIKTELLNFPASDFCVKKSVRSNRLLVLAELYTSGTQCIKNRTSRVDLRSVQTDPTQTAHIYNTVRDAHLSQAAFTPISYLCQIRQESTWECVIKLIILSWNLICWDLSATGDKIALWMTQADIGPMSTLFLVEMKHFVEARVRQ